jgi:hypothetical protein
VDGVHFVAQHSIATEVSWFAIVNLNKQRRALPYQDSKRMGMHSSHFTKHFDHEDYNIIQFYDVEPIL